MVKIIVKSTFKWIPLPAVLLVMACPNTPAEDFQSRFNVFGVMRNDFYVQDFSIDRTYAMDDTTGYDLQDAFAVIFDDSLCDTLYQYDPSTVLWHSDLSAQPGHTYRIMVCAEGLDTLWGETTVPGAYRVIFPQPGDTVYNDDTILIRKSDGAKVYEVQFLQNEHIYLAINFPDFLPDSMFRFPVSELTLLTGDQRLAIGAYDSNYFNYQYQFSEDYPQCGVRGGLGAFCSAYVNSVNFYYQP